MEITLEQKNEFISVLLINEMITNKRYFPIMMDSDNLPLSEIFIDLMSKGIVRIDSRNYVPTEKAREILKSFLARYSEYLKLFDIFCAVDLEKGEFAFSSIYDMDQDFFQEFLKQNRWEDLRIAVAQFKGIDPKEQVFMSFIQEGRFDLTKSLWQYDLISGEIWDDIEKICNSALTKDQMEKSANDIGLENVLEDVIKKGTEIAIELIKKGIELDAEDAKLAESQVEQEEYQETTTTYVDEVYMEDYNHGVEYYEPYYDPYYISPIWLALILI